MTESPFLTERARLRAPVVMSFAAAAGAALLVSERGEVALAHGVPGELDATYIVRRACGTRRSFRKGDACVYVIHVARGWLLIGVSLFPVAPAEMIQRLERAARVLALALSDRPGAAPGGGPMGGAPARAVAPFTRSAVTPRLRRS